MKKIAVMTYAKPNQVDLILKNHAQTIESYAWILHDKDKTDPHCHIFMTFNSDRRAVDILRWFECCTDIKDKPANTRWQTVKSNEGLLNYLIHSNAPDKHQYEEKQIKYSSEDAREELLAACNEDNGYDALDMLLSNTPLRQIAKQHGRDFIRHYSSYKLLADDIKREERKKKEDEELLKKIAELEQEKQEFLWRVKCLEQGKIDLKT